MLRRTREIKLFRQEKALAAYEHPKAEAKSWWPWKRSA
jgi:hypothetical protein